MKIGDIFEEKYEIIDILGKGGMGTVYLGRNIKLGTLWAIKEISKGGNARVDILAEPNILKKLEHPYLPRIFDIMEDEDNIYIIADYIEGTSLDRELKKGSRFDEKQVMEWAKQICEVLSYLHELSPNPIIYRDMKPSNLMLTKRGTIKLIDFGIAREYKTGLQSDTIYIGTRGYAAPEQYGTGQTNAASDIFSLGMTLHHLLTGKDPSCPPFEMRPVREYDDSLSEKIEGIVEKCTRQNPEERYQTARELLGELEAVEGCAPGKAGKNSCGEERLPVPPSFKRLVLAVLDNAEFACELACTAAKLTKYSILIINLERSSAGINFYLGLEKEAQDFGRMERYLEEDKLDFSVFEKETVNLNDCGKLYVFPSIDSPDNVSLTEEKYKKLFEEAYKNFDITILVVGRGPSEKGARAALEKSDFNILAARANLDVLSGLSGYMGYMEKEYGIYTSKNRFIAWEYKEGVNLPERLIKQLHGGGCYAGKLDYDVERERSKNTSCRYSYAKRAWKKHGEDYKKILRHFNIIPEETFKEYIKTIMKGILGS